MKLTTKRKIKECWTDMQWAINIAHARTAGCASWDEYCNGARSDRHSCEGLEYGGHNVLTTLTAHMASLSMRVAREAIRHTIDEIIFCSRWDSKTVDQIQAFFIEKMGPLYMEAVGKKGRILFWEVV
jgi:hypothetical protein